MRLIPILLLGILLIACGKKSKVPKGILPPEKMETVLWDMLAAGEFINGFVIAKDTGANRLSQTAAVYDAVYRIHSINQQQFNESFAWYQQHPALMKTMMDSLAVKTRPAAPETKKMADSLKLEITTPDTTKAVPVNTTIPTIVSDSVLRRQKGKLLKPKRVKPAPVS